MSQPKKYLHLLGFASTKVPRSRVQTDAIKLRDFADDVLEATKEIVFNTTVTPPTYLQADGACNISVELPQIDTLPVALHVDTLTQIVPFREIGGLPDSANYTHTNDGQSFVSAHGFGKLQSGKKAGVAFFPEVGLLRSNGTIVVGPGWTPEVGGATALAGSVWISVDRLQQRMYREITLVHELAHLLVGLDHSRLGDWDVVLNPLSQPYQDYYTHVGGGAVFNLTYDSSTTRHLSPVKTSTMMSNCARMRSNMNYVRDF